MTVADATLVDVRTELALAAWRLRDAGVALAAPAWAVPAADAAPGTAVRLPLGGIGIGAVHASAIGADRSGLATTSDLVRPCAVRVDYGPPASIGQTLVADAVRDEHELRATLSAHDTAVVTTRQALDGAEVDAPEGACPAHLATEEMHRVRLARWLYVTGELHPLLCNHEAAVKAGQPSAQVPVSLLVGLVERWALELVDRLASVEISLTAPLYAGTSLVVRASRDSRGEGPAFVTAHTGDDQPILHAAVFDEPSKAESDLRG